MDNMSAVAYGGGGPIKKYAPSADGVSSFLLLKLAKTMFFHR
jgi:hypothetical protein